MGVYDGVTALGIAEDDTNGDVEGASEDSTSVDDGYTISGKVEEKMEEDTPALLENVELADSSGDCEDVVVGDGDCEDVVCTVLDVVAICDICVE
ncbi:hypothetical protein N7509_002362 [Penicillium cosmopolitanum]|uniref:Uncharacterized protein n=1 Tax=Penicillium cosmopolitanum TaxID=1131564 RepID=A0A9X0BDE6_9EURO|nr:uncharacterized protein N7509_002362 [Penicillium cosmopolitanum]KAJ5408479.1 hypothetical protein N7509_002362 [Penicillium cosmopolitanum]